MTDGPFLGTDEMMKQAPGASPSTRTSSGPRKSSVPSKAKPVRVLGPTATVLVIDANQVTRRAISKLLTEAGMEAIELESTIGATRSVMAHKVTAVVLDVVTPGMRGDRLAALFRGNARFRHVVMVLISGEPDVDLQSAAHQAGADAALPASELRDLVPTIRKALRQRATLNA